MKFNVKYGDGNWMGSLAHRANVELISVEDSKDLGQGLTASLEPKDATIQGDASNETLVVALVMVVVVTIIWLILRHSAKPKDSEDEQ